MYGDCKADYGLCSGAVLYGYKAVQCEMLVRNDCCFITYSYNKICNIKDSFFSEKLNLEEQNSFNPSAKDREIRTPSTGTNKNKFREMAELGLVY